jgi:ATP-dependent DNA helicase RecG
MTSYSDAQLEAMLLDLESDLVERKRSGADRSGIRRNICAFANDLPGHGRPGLILVGVEDDGTCANISIDDPLLRNLAQMRDDGNILPIPAMEVRKHRLGNCDVAVIEVQPASAPPVRYQGRVWIKVGPTVRQATPDEERQLSERRRATDLPFDMRPVGEATLDDLDLDYAKTGLLPQAVAADVLGRNQRPLEEQLRSLRLVSKGHPTWGALLALGKDPQSWLPGAYIQFLRIDGTAITDPIRHQKSLTGRLEDTLRRMEELIEINVSVRTRIDERSREHRHPDYPIVALKQLAHNAVMHRSYEGTNAPVQIYWYSDRVEIRSPGGLYGRMNPQNFGKGETDYRNPLVAELMHHLGFAQRFGLGVPLARRELAKNGNPEPEFRFEPTLVEVVLRPAR